MKYRKVAENRNYIQIVLLTVCLLLAICSAGRAVEEKEGKTESQDTTETQDTMSSIEEYTIEQKDAAMVKAQELIDSLDAKMSVWEEDLEKKWDSLKDSSKETFQESKKEFREQRAELSVWLEKMQNSSGEAWVEVKQGFSDAYDAFVTTWNKTEEEMENEASAKEGQAGEVQQ